MGKTPKLYEVLAVEKDLENSCKKVVEEAMVTFSKKTDHFTGMIKRCEMFDDERQKEADALKEQKEIVTTVAEKIKYVTKSVVKYFDTIGKKEATNQEARADLVLDDGTELIKDVPATLLLGLESRLLRIRELYNLIPTLTPGYEWALDSDKGEGVYKTQDDLERNKTEKKLQFDVIVPATKEHPAQVKEWMEEKIIGKFVTTHWSGAITPARKSVLLGRIDEVMRCVKKARTRANSTDIKNKNVGKEIFAYING